MLPPRRAPFGRRAGQPSEGAPTRSACPGLLASAARPHCGCWEKSRTRTSPLAIFPTPWGTCLACYRAGTELLAVEAQACGAVGGQTGTNHLGWYACPRLTLFATEWSAARRKPVRAAAMHPGAALSADVKARRLPTSGRRKFPSAEIFDARAT